MEKRQLRGRLLQPEADKLERGFLMIPEEAPTSTAQTLPEPKRGDALGSFQKWVPKRLLVVSKAVAGPGLGLQNGWCWGRTEAVGAEWPCGAGEPLPRCKGMHGHAKSSAADPLFGDYLFAQRVLEIFAAGPVNGLCIEFHPFVTNLGVKLTSLVTVVLPQGGFWNRELGVCDTCGSFLTAHQAPSRILCCIVCRLVCRICKIFSTVDGGGGLYDPCPNNLGNTCTCSPLT